MIRAQKNYIYNKRNSNMYTGLTEKEAEIRLRQYGKNEIVEKKRISALHLFLGQFKDFITLVLLIATMISFLIGEIPDAITITIIIILNAILGFIQEYKTEKSLEALKELSAPHALILRDGKKKKIAAADLVPGDLIILEAGDRVPADCVAFEAINLYANESILTGESIPVKKESVKFNKIDLNNKKIISKNTLYMGTTITMGKTKTIATNTGMQTEMGKIAHMIQGVQDEETPLKKRLDKIGKELVLISVLVCGLIILAGIYHGESLHNMFLSGVSLAVAAIPEGLPAIVTVSLALAVQRMLKRKALIRRLPAVETLGSINVICSDKTGTLTENKMTVKKIYTDEGLIEVTGSGYDTKGDYIINNRKINLQKNEPLKMLLTIGALCNNSEYKDGNVSGDPTEAAILIASKKAGIDKESLRNYRRIAENPFDSIRKRMSVIYRDKNNDMYLFVKGAPDIILNLCNQKLTNKGVTLLTRTQNQAILKANEIMAKQALRNLAFAYKKIEGLPQKIKDIDIEKNLIYVGIEGMIDPPRPEAIKAIKSCYKAGIKPVMITGDHKGTAIAVAKELGLNINTKNVLIGDEIEAMNDRKLEEKVEGINVFARVLPKHKLRIVQALKRRKNIVAMTGDGVNDAPALKEADIGIAMGQSGTDVAKEASSMVLLDDNFATIVAAIEEGRIIYDNIRKFIKYLLSCNLGEILMMGIAAFLGMPLPLVAIQILWINLVTDGLPALALGIDPPDKNIMERAPRTCNEGIFSKKLGTHIIFTGLLIGVSSLIAFATTVYLTGGDILKARTVAFTTMIIIELGYSFECSNNHRNIFKKGFFKNKHLILATLISFLLTIVVMYVPTLSEIFKTVALGFNEWIIVIIFSVIGSIL